MAMLSRAGRRRAGIAVAGEAPTADLSSGRQTALGAVDAHPLPAVAVLPQRPLPGEPIGPSSRSSTSRQGGVSEVVQAATSYEALGAKLHRAPVSRPPETAAVASVVAPATKKELLRRPVRSNAVGQAALPRHHQGLLAVAVASRAQIRVGPVAAVGTRTTGQGIAEDGYRAGCSGPGPSQGIGPAAVHPRLLAGATRA